MHIAFAIIFFLFIGLCETLRHGVFGLNASEASQLISGAMLLCAVGILRADVVHLIRAPGARLYDRSGLRWSWGQTALGLMLMPVLWVIVIAYGFAVSGISVQSGTMAGLTPVLISQLLFVALAEQLFFREAAIKAFGSDLGATYLVSGLACFIFYFPAGPGVAMAAAGAGLFYLTLRLIGTNSLAVAGIQAATTLIFAHLIRLDLTASDVWAFGLYALTAAIVASVVILGLFARNRNEVRYA